MAKPAVKVGDDARLAYRRIDAAFDALNARMTQSAGWYDDLRKRYSGK
jgi:hypothetical protein